MKYLVSMILLLKIIFHDSRHSEICDSSFDLNIENNFFVSVTYSHSYENDFLIQKYSKFSIQSEKKLLFQKEVLLREMMREKKKKKAT